MKSLLLLSTLVTTYLCFVTAQSQCSTPSGKSGKCLSIKNCSILLKLTSNPSPSDQALLRNSFCGYAGSLPKVCCPSDTCTTPAGTQGTCIGLLSCPHVANLMKSEMTSAVQQYLQEYGCDGSEPYSVCCEPLANPIHTPNTTPADKCQLTAFPPDSSTQCCGRDASGIDNKVVGGNATAVDEYPWLALIEYNETDTVEFLNHTLGCGGVLISGRYVLTAGHCVLRLRPGSPKPVNVILGEYDTSNAGQDCVIVEGGGQDCNEGALTVPIEKTIPHPEYNPASKLRRHDIALIRLAQLVQYTDFIRPICLPSVDFTTAPQPGVLLHAAGWGAVSHVQPWSNIKQKIRLPYLSQRDCQPSYWRSVLNHTVELWNGQICAGGVNGYDSCKGDSGGPLMRKIEQFYELVGIINFGISPCGTRNVPSVNTKVYTYLPWIINQIKA